MKEIDVSGLTETGYHVLTGRIGSGKTEIAVNLAIKMAQANIDTVLFDLDIVKPYVRIRDIKEKLSDFSFKIITPPDITKTLDLPILPPYIVGKLMEKDGQKIIDLGGDAYGAGSFAQFRNILKNRKYDLMFVINTKRPGTSTPEEIIDSIKEIEFASRMQITSLILNTNLRWETSKQIVEEGLEIVEEVSKRTKKPIRFACVEENHTEYINSIDLPILKMKLFVNPLPRV